MDHILGLIPEHKIEGKRLGRHIHFDKRSRGFRVPQTGEIVSNTWDRSIPAFDQKSTGACTGNGAAGVLCTLPYCKDGIIYDESLARSIYSKATELDSIYGSWPPDDTGSTVLSAMKACVELGFASGYQWCFGIDDVLRTLSNFGPVEVGVSWFEGFDRPDSDGLVTISGSVRGGHAFELLGIDAENELVIAENSWGIGWGLNGRFSFSWTDLDRLLQEQGEAATIVSNPCS